MEWDTLSELNSYLYLIMKNVYILYIKYDSQTITCFICIEISSEEKRMHRHLQLTF